MFKAVYEPHPGQESAHRYLLRFEFDPTRPADGWVIITAQDRNSGALLTTLRLNHTTSAGIANQYIYSSQSGVSAQMEELNRDLSFSTEGKEAHNEWLAPYAVLFTDLFRDLYYLHGEWDRLGPNVTFHTRQQVKPLFPNMWIVADCA